MHAIELQREASHHSGVVLPPRGRYLGESEKHIQSLFEPAEAEYAESTCRHALVPL